ncbi:hypothetical protein NMY22_g494 [Coprinellus aureogranulatus]|nr:hypothetical protein NMY22_g494 [Coprinellus aureogranulatus]
MPSKRWNRSRRTFKHRLPPIAYPCTIFMHQAREPQTAFAANDGIPANRYTLGNIVEWAEHLEKNSRFDEHARFILSGVISDDTISLDLSKNELKADIPSGYVTHYASTIVGISKRILLSAYPLSVNADMDDCQPPMDIHVLHAWKSATDGVVTAPLKDIPHMKLGSLGHNQHIYIIFPDLHRPDGAPTTLTPEQMQLFWKTILLPNLPSEPENGRGCFVVPKHDIDLFSKLVRYKAMEVMGWMEHFLYVQIVLDESEAFKADEAEKAMRVYIADQGLSFAGVEADIDAGALWYVDVGVEVSHKVRSVVWKAGHHSALYRELTGQELDRTRENYVQHLFSYMAAASGFRATCSTPLQTDRRGSPTYVEVSFRDTPLHLVDAEGKHFDSLDCRHVVKKPANWNSLLSTTASLYKTAVADISSLAVARVPLCGATPYIHALSPANFIEACFVFDTQDIWLWRYHRVVAMNHVLELQRGIASELSPNCDRTILLIATITWLMNGLHQSRLALRQLPSSLDSGIVFLSDISFPGDPGAGPTPKFRDVAPQASIEEAELEILLGGTRREIIQALKSSGPIICHGQAARPAPSAELPFSVIQVALGGIPPKPLYQTSGGEHLDSIPLQEVMVYAETLGLQAAIADVMADFFVDIVSKIPSRTARPPGDRLPTGGEALFHRRNLAAVFRLVRWRHATMNDWVRSFNILFPSSSGGMLVFWNSPLELKRCNYYQRWERLASELDSFTFNVLRRAIWVAKFKQLYWVPRCSSTSIFTNGTGTGYRTLPSGTQPLSNSDDRRASKGVNVLINGALDPIFDSDIPF